MKTKTLQDWTYLYSNLRLLDRMTANSGIKELDEGVPQESSDSSDNAHEDWNDVDLSGSECDRDTHVGSDSD